MIDAIQKSNFPSSVNEFLREFETIKKFNFDIHKNVNDLSKSELEKLISPIQKNVVDQTMENLTGSGVNSNFIEPVRQGVFKNIVAGSTITDLESSLKTFIQGTGDTDGLLMRYTKQVSRDALNQFDGQTNARIASEFDLDAFRYVGSLIDDSRPQCRRWVAKSVLLRDDLQNEINWAFNNGSGMNKATTPDNFAVYRGGYSCRHSAIPFKMTKSQREKYGLEQAQAEPVAEKKVEQQIVEVQNDIDRTIKINRNQANEPNKIIDSLFLSTQSDKLNKEMNDVISFADGGIDIINDRKTNVSLRTPSESTMTGGIKMKRDKGIDVYRTIGSISKDSMGNCATTNTFLNIKIKKTDVIEFKKIEMKIDQSIVDQYILKGYSMGRSGGLDVLADKNGLVSAFKTNDGWRFWSVSSSNTKRVNIAPTITHETAHLIQNAKDTGDRIVRKLFVDLDLKLSDAPTQYGKTNNHEFWTESFTYYVYDNANLKKDFPKIFDFVEKYLEEMNIDLKTIKLAE
jgi:hypothetical protein